MAEDKLLQWRSLEFPDVSRENGGHVSRTYKATITQLLRQSITHLIRTVQYMYIAADETLDDLQLPI